MNATKPLQIPWMQLFEPRVSYDTVFYTGLRFKR
jgi:hypothetical protein